MDYREQQAYLRSSRIRGIVSVAILGAIAAACVFSSGPIRPASLTVFALVALALAASIYYCPDYLHLTVVPYKPARWQVKIRWRIVAAVLVLGLLAATTAQGRLVVVGAAVWLCAVNFAIKKLASLRHFALLFWASDLALLAALMLAGSMNLLLGSILLVASVHLAILTGKRSGLLGIPIAAAALLVSIAARVYAYSLVITLLCVALVAIIAIMTTWSVSHAEGQKAANVAAAMSELVEFTGYTPERISQLWESSNQQLAKNWEQAAIPQNDRERMAEWYRQNSELYLFAISAYNLEYKRIKSNLKVIRFARGSCLDYGAGNGEILLELARRGHPVTYFDVEGVTMKFAQKRAQQHGLAMDVARSKDELKAAAQKRGFDTIFSFDVLEHLPDLPGELTFLSSLLAPNGVFVFDVPAGSTKAHPMHLNHTLNVLDFLSAKGLKDRRTFSLRMPFRKEEKYVFEA
ncbi:MAG TPA: class I SAM-dependent methyltransferase [Candidatus Angelobacter sp.]|nr:class I SAM-dependent methyltransferase [Candidatus Angelobacter sp.]